VNAGAGDKKGGGDFKRSDNLAVKEYPLFAKKGAAGQSNKPAGKEKKSTGGKRQGKN